MRGHDDDTIRYTCDGPQHSTALKRNEGMNELNVRATGLAAFCYYSSLLFQFAFCSRAIYIGETPFLFAPAFLFGGFRLQSGVREVFLSRQKIELELEIYDDDTAEKSREKQERRKIKSGLYDDIDDDK